MKVTAYTNVTAKLHIQSLCFIYTIKQMIITYFISNSIAKDCRALSNLELSEIQILSWKMLRKLQKMEKIINIYLL